MQVPRHKELLKAKLRRWEPERVRSAAKLVRQLMAQQGWAEIQLLLGQVKDGHEQTMLEGRTLEQADYARMIGVIQGLRTLQDVPEALFEVAREIDEKGLQEADEPQAAAKGA